MAWEVGQPLKRDGISQRQRLQKALSPAQNPIDDRRVEDLLLFLYRLADQFAYYNHQNIVDGNWRAFFAELTASDGTISLDSIRAYLQAAEQRKDNSIFSTILLTFLKLYGYLQADINTLTQKHLEFYYEQVLGFQRQSPQPDEVHLLFQLAQQAVQHRIPVGTALKAGKDSKGKPRTYVTNREIIVNKAQIAAIKTVLLQPEGAIYQAAVANSEDGLGTPLLEEPPRWHTFGNAANMQLGTIGFAIASPLLLLREGVRTITLTLTFSAPLPDRINQGMLQQFVPYGSGEAAWIKLQHRNPSISSTRREVIFTIQVFVNQAAIVPYNANVLDGRLNTTFPVLRMLLDPERSPYVSLRGIAITQIQLKVAVTASDTQPGVQNLIVQNDQGVLNAKSAFQPFGATPARNSLFYIGSREVFSKPLDNLTIQLRWSDLPTDATGFAGYYTNYPATFTGKNNNAYKASFQLLQNKSWSTSFAAGKPLFAPETNDQLTANKTINLTNTDSRPLQTLELSPALPDFEEWDSNLKQGFIRLALSQDFGQRIFVTEFAKIARSGGAFPNTPYTPAIQSISLGYETTPQTIELNRPTANAQVFHILPFGSDELELGNSHPLLPAVPSGALYLGIKDLQPPQNLHLLFQIAEGSAFSTDIIRREDIRWSYLTHQGWRTPPLSGSELFIDTTQGLQKSGIIAFSIGRDAVANTTLLPTGLHWLRATIEKDPAGAARTIAIHTQAITAIFQNKENTLSHFDAPLPVGSVQALVQSDQAIKKVEQPYASFAGKPAEQNDRFYTRVSERLRHKQRAITLWDIEHLVLQAFPEIYKVKTIPHTGFNIDNLYSEFQPGQVMVVVIPQLRNQNAVNPLEPRASVALLEDVRRYLLPLTTQFVARARKDMLHTVNPRYEPIQLSFSVGFLEGFDAGFYSEVLNAALRRHLSPWAFEEGVDIQFGGKIYKSQLLAFVEEQPYVDYVTDFKMLHGNAGPGIGEMCVEIDFLVYGDTFGNEVEVAVASTARSILVSAQQHLIRVLQPDEYPCVEPNICGEGIGCWYIEIDFIVS